MRYIILLMSLSLAVINAKDYSVKLFDTNISQGIWQMVGTQGLKDISVEGVTFSSSADASTNYPVIPDAEDTGLDDNLVDGVSTVYNESGVSEAEINIVNVFDTNLSDGAFNRLNPINGELSIYRYNGSGFEDVWSYYNSKNSLEGNDFIKLEKGRGYWAKYQNDIASFDTNHSYNSNAGFIFNDDFRIGIETYTDKIANGWNLLSLPEKRTIENVYMVILDFDNTKDNNFTVSRKDDLNKIKVDFDNNAQLIPAVTKFNSDLSALNIIAIQSNINSRDQIILLSRKDFVISETVAMTTLSIPNLTSVNSDGNKTILSKSIYGLVLDMNSSFISNFSSLNIDLNGEDIDLTSSNLESSTKDINSINLIGTDKNLTLLFSENVFYIENKNYIKSYEYNGSARPNGFYSVDENQTIFQITDNRKDINESLTITQNSSKHEIFRGYRNVVDFISNLMIDSTGVITFADLYQVPSYLKTYAFPKTDNLKFFLSHVFDGYVPTQILSLKTEPTINGDWNSMPINNDLTDWNSFVSRYDRLFYVDKRKSYWVKFSESTSTTLDVQIDDEQTSISRDITHQLSDDNLTITNIVHYNVQIFLKNVTKSVRGYVKVENLEIDLKPELDGSLLTAEIDYESLYQISNLDNISEVTAVVVDENGIENSIVLDINFTKPDKPSDLIKLVDIIDDSFYRIYQNGLENVKAVESLYPELCQDLGVTNLFVTKVDNSDISLNTNQLIFSDPVKIVYASMYKGTSKLTSATDSNIEQPIKYDSNCEKVSAEPVETEGVTVGSSSEQIYLFYKKSSEYLFDTLSAPKVMYIEINNNTVQIEFDSSYEGYDFYILDSVENVFKGQFISDDFDDDTSPYLLTQIR